MKSKVLPPWGPLYHWDSPGIGPQVKIPWSLFFDLNEMNKYISVIELTKFIQESSPSIEIIYYLQNFPNLEENWSERYEITSCPESLPFMLDADGMYEGWFWGYEEIFAQHLACVNILGSGKILFPLLKNFHCVLLERAETLLHETYGDRNYWKARKSMKFASHLINIAETFLSEHSLRPLPNGHKGDYYAAAHLRRKDFLYKRKNSSPSMLFAAKQIIPLLQSLNLDKLYLATDGTASDINVFEEALNENNIKLFQFKPPHNLLKKIGDGGKAIVDQIICSYAKYFIGTHESTFTFRIYEERELLNLHPNTTFNRFCSDNENKCSQPTQWRNVL